MGAPCLTSMVTARFYEVWTNLTSESAGGAARAEEHRLLKMGTAQLSWGAGRMAGNGSLCKPVDAFILGLAAAPPSSCCRGGEVVIGRSCSNRNSEGLHGKSDLQSGVTL